MTETGQKGGTMWRLRHAVDVIVCWWLGHDWKQTDFRHFAVRRICDRCQRRER